MQILELSTGNVSLEFGPEEAGEVLRRLKSFGKVRRSSHVIHDLLKVGDVEIIYYHEWEEPCLISVTEAGSHILRELNDNPSGRAAA